MNATGPDDPIQDVRDAVRALLAERFKLAVHQAIPGTIAAIGVPIESLSTSLGRFVDRVVTNDTKIDRTMGL